MDEFTPSHELGLQFHEWVASHEGWLTESETAMRADEFARQLTLEQVIRIEKRVGDGLRTLQEFRVHHDDVIRSPGGAARNLAHVLARMAGRVIVIEVNFDRLVEQLCRVPTRVFFSDAHFETAAEYVRQYGAGTETAIPVLKLHGSIEEPDTCVVSDEQMQQGVGQGKLNSLRAVLQEPPLWIYVGASMRDRDLRYFYRSEEFAKGVEELWVSPYLDVSVADVARDRAALWEKPERAWISDHLVTETADAFFQDLRDELP
ncbi:MAG TPA: SIR2 family protein [Thermoanaerobaculia bacterium]|nr:SIR2 family protein [Thermoanaerobaculia bacterium]